MIYISSALFLITITSSVVGKPKRAVEGAIKNKTPCCIDRLSTVSCQRLQLFNPSLFLYSCVHNADFAFVQCCRTCFTQRTSHSIDLDYKNISENLLTNAASAICYDRRGKEWCEAMVYRKDFWSRPEYAQLGCSSMPFSFRVCRKSCGYCSTIKQIAGAVYDFSVATDYRRCSSQQQAFAVDIRKHNLTELTIKQKWSRFEAYKKSKKNVTNISSLLTTIPPITEAVTTVKARRKKIRKTKKAKNKYGKRLKSTADPTELTPVTKEMGNYNSESTPVDIPTTTAESTVTSVEKPLEISVVEENTTPEYSYTIMSLTKENYLKDNVPTKENGDMLRKEPSLGR